MEISVARQPRVSGGGAIFSDDRAYRYSLWRNWSTDPKRVFFVMLNPSIADELRDDPTQRRCRRFAYEWGYGGYVAGNIFAYVSRDPKKLMNVGDPVGIKNDYYLTTMHKASALTVIAWGRFGNLMGRGAAVLNMLEAIKPVMSLGICKNGNPKHPLYLKANLKPTWHSTHDS